MRSALPRIATLRPAPGSSPARIRSRCRPHLEQLEERNLLTFYGGYRTVDELYADLATVTQNYPQITQLVDYGSSYAETVGGVTTPGGDVLGGYDLLAVQVTNQAIPGPKPVFLLTAGVHAREISGPEVAMRFLDWLTQGYGSDPDATWLVDYHEIWIVPDANPDGHWFVELGTQPRYGGTPFLWRKNGHLNSCTAWPPSEGRQGGVDINRNYDDHWGGPGSSSNPCDQTYRGPSAASEPETAAMQNLVNSLIPAQRGPRDTDPAPDDTTGISIDVHTFAGDVLWPWGHTTSLPPNNTGLSAIGRKFATSNGYRAGQTARILYLASGSGDSYVYGRRGAPGFTFELNSGTFLAPYSTLDSRLWPENRDAFVYAAKIARTPYRTAQGPDTLQASTYLDGTDLYVFGTLDDARTSGRSIAAGEFYIDTPPWVDGAVPLPLYPSDGAFDMAREDAYGYQSIVGLTTGRHIVFLRGQDAAGNWGPFSAAFFDVASNPGGPDGTALVVVLVGRAETGGIRLEQGGDPVLAETRWPGEQLILVSAPIPGGREHSHSGANGGHRGPAPAAVEQIFRVFTDLEGGLV